MDALMLLIADHNRVRGLFARFTEAEEADDTATQREIAPKIVDELTVHTTIEEEIFYPIVRPLSEEIGDLVTEGIEEHNVAKDLLEQIRSMEVGVDEWAAKVKVLIENVEHHADEEEEEMFPKVRTASTAADREGWAERLTARKKELGAPTLEDAVDMSDDQLRELASQQQIPGRSKMDHTELAATVDPRG